MDIFDRLAQGSGSMRPKDYDNWNQMVGSAPPDRFGRAAYDAVRQIDPQDYYRHTQPDVDGTDPFGSLEPQQRGGLLGSLLGNLFNRGLSPQDIASQTGLGHLDPNRMSPQEAAVLAQWAQRNHPKAFGYAAAEYRDQPDLLGSLLGNKGLMLMATALGAKMLSDRARR
jgi:hypothetical protein